MKEYRRLMEQVTLSDEKKEEIMGMLKDKQAQKRRMPGAARIALAAALVMACAAMIAAGLRAQVYDFIGGGSVTIDPGTDTAYYDRLYAVDPVEMDADGRVWFTADGQHMDITGEVDENTPYIYARTDEADGQRGYLVVGGSHDSLGWMEWYQIDGDWFWHAENCLNGVSASGNAERTMEGGTEPYEIDFRPWVEAAIEQLAGMGVVEYQPQVD